MTPERFQEVDRIVNLAFDQPEEHRTAFVDRECATDPELRAAVNSLLDCERKLGAFLADPPSKLAEDLVTHGPLAPGTRLGRYTIVERLGGGGMGLVYAAYDRELERKLAIKVVRPDTSDGSVNNRGARLLREAQAMARLSHPNVVQVYEVGTFGEQVFIAMEHVEGTTLARWLADQKRSWREIVKLFAEAGRALAAAHAAGIVHRDFKPQNVLVDKTGRARVSDFGLARSTHSPEIRSGLSSDPPAPAENDEVPGLGLLGAAVTAPGKFIGTPSFMAPEQLQGKPSSEKSDQFAFCVTLYQGLCGELPFRGETTQALLAEMRRGVFDGRRMWNGIPAWLRHVVLRGLKFDPAERHASMESLLDQLVPPIAPDRRAAVIGLVAIGFAMLVIGRVFLPREATKLARPGMSAEQAVQAAPSIAVLPFVNLSSEADQEYFSDGLTEELLSLLTRVPGLRVAARTSAFAFKGKSADIPTIAKKLSVGAVLEGSARKEGNRIRISTQLINASDGYHLWSETYDRELTDVFAVQDEIARAVVAALKLKLLQVPTSRDRHTDSPEAYTQYLRGRQLFRQGNADGHRRAQLAYEKALVLDPSYAPAWAGLAAATYSDSEAAESLAGVDEAQRRALAAANKAVALGSDLAEGYLVRGFLRAAINWDWQGARADMERAVALNPEDVDGLHASATCVLRAQGQLPAGVVALQKAAERDPLNPQVWTSLGGILVFSGQLSLAREALTRSLEISPEQAFAPYNLGVTLLLEHQPAAALAASQRSTHAAFRLAGAALAQHDLGKARDSQRALDELIASSGHAAAYQVAQVYAWQGDKDRAFEWLERALRQRDGGLTIVKVDRLLGKLRDDPRYATLLRKMNVAAD